MQNRNLSLEFVKPSDTPKENIDLKIEAHLLANGDTWYRCGGPSSGGLSGFDDSKRKFICPTYGQN